MCRLKMGGVLLLLLGCSPVFAQDQALKYGLALSETEITPQVSLQEGGGLVVVTLPLVSVLMDVRTGRVLDRIPGQLDHRAALVAFKDRYDVKPVPFRVPLDLLSKAVEHFGNSEDARRATSDFDLAQDLFRSLEPPDNVSRLDYTKVMHEALPPPTLETPWGEFAIISLADAAESEATQCMAEGGFDVEEARLQDLWLDSQSRTELSDADRAALNASIEAFLLRSGVPREKLKEAVANFKEEAARKRVELNRQAKAMLDEIINKDCVAEAKADPASGRVCPFFAIDKAVVMGLAPPPLKPFVESLYGENGEKVVREGFNKVSGSAP